MLAQDSGSGFITTCSKPGVVALTFDDGPGPYTNSLLDYLSSKQIKATFFVVGISIKEYPELLKKIFKEGHQIGIHTNTHPHLNELTPPFGECNDRCGKLMKSLGLTVTQWNMDSGDWRYEKESYEDGRFKSLNNMLDCLSPSNSKINSFITLQHDHCKYSVDVVPKIVEAFEKKGYKFETVAE
ncbi:4801_t:CDS:2, partial [Cetraspora pellucida]